MKTVEILHGAYAGQRCFILGNGPSLNKIDFNLLRDETTFGVNSFFLMTERNGFAPTYFVVEDNLVFKENKEAIERYSQPRKILPVDYAKQISMNQEDLVFQMDTSFYNRKDKLRFGIPQFNTGPTPKFFCGQSVTYINMQLAYYMGFSEVYLIGMDFSYSRPSDHKQEGNHIHSQGDDPNHFHKDYFGAGKTWKDPKLGRVLRSYGRAKFEFESVGRKIFNATFGGELELFERREFKSLF